MTHIVLSVHARARLSERFPGMDHAAARARLAVILDEAVYVCPGAHPTSHVLRHPDVIVIVDYAPDATRIVSLLPPDWPIAAPGDAVRLPNGHLPATGRDLARLRAHFAGGVR